MSNKKDMNSLIVKLANYDPCCYGNGESFTYYRGKNWINYGSDNLLDKYIRDLMDMSEAHSAIIKKLSSMIVGKGLIMPTDPASQRIWLNDHQTGEFRSKLYKHDLNTLLPKIVYDLVLYGGFYLKVKWGPGHLRTAYVDSVPFKDVRISSANDGYWVSDDWSNYRKDLNRPKFYPNFSDDPKSAYDQIYAVYLPETDVKGYPQPYYWAARTAIECVQEIGVWNISHLKNAFGTDVLVTYPNGLPDEEEMYRTQKAFKDHYQGSSGTKAMHLDGNIELKEFPKSRLPLDIVQITEDANSRIRTGHGVVGKGELFSFDRQTQGMNFSTESLIQEWNAYNTLKVQPMQKVILDGLNLLCVANSSDHQFKIEPFVLFDGSDPITNSTTNV